MHSVHSSARLRAKVASWALGLAAAGACAAAFGAPNQFCVFVDCPGTPFSSGHVFISLTAGTNFRAAGTTYTRGIAPDSFDIFGGAGKIQDDGCHGWDWKICWDVPDAKYVNVANFINNQQNNPPNYDLLDSNCVAWAQNAAGVAGVMPPAGSNRVGILDPKAMCDDIMAIGDGNTSKGGTVMKNPNSFWIEDQEYLDFSYVGQESDLHTTTASQVGAFMHLPGTDSSAGSVNVGTGLPLQVILSGAQSDSLLSVDWGDGSTYDAQMFSYSHSYGSPGSYSGSVAVIDSGSVQRYAFTANVGVGGPNALNVLVQSGAPSTELNGGGCGLGGDIDTALAPEPASGAFLGAIGATSLTLRRRRARSEYHSA